MAQQYDFYRQIPLQIPHQYANEHTSKPRVLIAGGGIGGLTLGILLKKAGVPFEIFERNYDINDRGNLSLPYFFCSLTHSLSHTLSPCIVLLQAC